MRRGLFSYRYMKRNLLVAATTVVTVAGIGLVVKYGEALDHNPAYLNSQTIQTVEVETTSEETALSIRLHIRTIVQPRRQHRRRQ